MNEVSRNRVICPYCGYRMPVEFDSTASAHGIYVRCKGNHCKQEFEIVVKDGVQYKRPWLYDKILGVFRYIF